MTHGPISGLGSNIWLYLYLNKQLLVFVFDHRWNLIFVFAFVFDWYIWCIKKIQIQFLICHFPFASIHQENEWKL